MNYIISLCVVFNIICECWIPDLQLLEYDKLYKRNILTHMTNSWY